MLLEPLPQPSAMTARALATANRKIGGLADHSLQDPSDLFVRTIPAAYMNALPIETGTASTRERGSWDGMPTPMSRPGLIGSTSASVKFD
jgi:hypothetical protein